MGETASGSGRACFHADRHRQAEFVPRRPEAQTGAHVRGGGRFPQVFTSFRPVWTSPSPPGAAPPNRAPVRISEGGQRTRPQPGPLPSAPQGTAATSQSLAPWRGEKNVGGAALLSPGRDSFPAHVCFSFPPCAAAGSSRGTDASQMVAGTGPAARPQTPGSSPQTPSRTVTSGGFSGAPEVLRQRDPSMSPVRGSRKGEGLAEAKHLLGSS